MKFKFDWFLWGMVVAVGLAWVVPAPGAAGGWMHPDLLNKIGVALIFFLNGVSLSFAALRAGTLRWPLHVVVQSSVFLLFPVIGLAALWLTHRWLPGELDDGFFYLCVLPSTVSSSVALTAAARGNVPAAVFNATLSSLLGVFLTPLWIGWRMHNGGQVMPMGKVVLDLVLWLLLPLLLGQLSRPLLSGWAGSNKKLIHVVDRGTILLIIYTSFCDSVKGGVWRQSGTSELLIAVVGCAGLFFIVMAIMGAVSDALGFSVEDRITTVFCGSKKSIAQGVPMARLIFGTNPHLSVILLPIMIYHPLQLVICGVLAGRWALRPQPAA